MAPIDDVLPATPSASADVEAAWHCPCEDHLQAALTDGCPCGEEGHVHYAAIRAESGNPERERSGE